MAPTALTAGPVAWLIAVSATLAVVLRALTGPGTTAAVALGAAGPLAGAVATWLVVARTHARAPAAVPGLMIKLFGAKLVGFGAYIAAVVLLLLDETRPFVVSFTCQYIGLHLVQAIYLRRLFASL